MRAAIIPARGGSKRIPRKNIRDFHGKPIIAWSIEAAIASGCFDQVIVSTDDKEIADISLQWGAHVPFLRSADLADDFAPTVPVIIDAIARMNATNVFPTEVCCIYATAPFINPDDIHLGLSELLLHDCDYAFTVSTFPAPVQRALKITDERRLKMLYPEHASTRSQELEPAYHDAGMFYWGKASAWLASKSVFTADSVPIVLPRERVQDIDTPEDWRRAEALFSLLQCLDDSAYDSSIS